MEWEDWIGVFAVLGAMVGATVLLLLGYSP